MITGCFHICIICFIMQALTYLNSNQTVSWMWVVSSSQFQIVFEKRRKEKGVKRKLCMISMMIATTCSHKTRVLLSFCWKWRFYYRNLLYILLNNYIHSTKENKCIIGHSVQVIRLWKLSRFTQCVFFHSFNKPSMSTHIADSGLDKIWLYYHKLWMYHTFPQRNWL